MTISFPFDGGFWRVVKRTDPAAVALADRHYSRQTVGAQEFMGPGRTLVMLGDRCVWGVNENLDGGGAMRWRCTMFRNEGPVLSSTLIREATARTFEFWRRRFGGIPERNLTTEINIDLTRKKRDPGRCFLRAGWKRLPNLTTKGLVVLEAPIEGEHCPGTTP